MELEPISFEHLANRLVARMLSGKAKDTQTSRDGGIDGFINVYTDPFGFNTVGVQAKRYTAGNVGSDDMQKFLGALDGMDGVFVTCSDFNLKIDKSVH